MAARKNAAAEKQSPLQHDGSPAGATEATPGHASWSAIEVPLWCENSAANTSVEQPLTFGIPLPRGRVFEPCRAALCFSSTNAVSESDTRYVQCQPLAWWSDGSVRWLLVDVLAPPVAPGRAYWTLRLTPCKESHNIVNEDTSERAESDRHLVDAKGFACEVLSSGATPLLFKTCEGRGQVSACWQLTDARGQAHTVQFHSVEIETSGTVRTTFVVQGTLPAAVGLNCRLRASFFAGSSLVKMQVTLHNPRRAHHEGGLWDLGDPSSVQLQSWVAKFAFAPEASAAEVCRIAWQAELTEPVHESSGDVLVYQDSSGGENWRSPVHMNRSGRVPCQFRGYRVKHGNTTTTGLRTTPTLAVQRGAIGLTATVPNFWQQFPLSLQANSAGIEVGLFPSKWSDRFELQGGEQKTHTIWLQLDAAQSEGQRSLSESVRNVAETAHHPLVAGCDPKWYATVGAMSYLMPAPAESMTPTCQGMLAAALEGERSFPAKREKLDEYGWRNYGDVWADHEQPAYKGSGVVISHYNNQFDLVCGGLRQFMQMGQPAWWNFALALAQHVIDIDLYRTTKDRAAYSGGMFWFTDHFYSAATSTHRTYSRQNAPQQEGRRERADYGGGPGSEHNFATGLLYYYWMSGDSQAAEAVQLLGDWVIAMDDGRQNILGLLDDGPTGLASMSNRLNHQGPGRGAANSMQTLLDAWLLTRDEQYLTKCEEILCRVIHPADDVASRNLLDAEHHWSYTMFLAAVVRYLDITAEAGREDRTTSYARESLLHYARWMADNERPYLDHPEPLEFPTETWAAQDLRKANVLRLAARYATDAEVAAKWRQRGEAIANRAWHDLQEFSTRQTTRAVAIVMTEGAIDGYLRTNHETASAKKASATYDFGQPDNFVPQRLRIRNRLCRPGGVCKLVLAALRPTAWFRLVRLYKSHRA